MSLSLRERAAVWDRAAEEYVAHGEHVSPGVVVADDGTHLGVVRMAGKPLALMDDAGRYAERRRRHGVLRALADANVQVHEHLVSHDGVPPYVPDGFRSHYGRSLSRDYGRAVASGLFRR